LPLNSAFSFSRNAVVPSLKSSVAKHSPKAFISTSNPLTPDTKLAFTASIALKMAIGEFLMYGIFI